MSRACLFVVGLFFSGFVSATEVKEASSQLGVALEQLQKAQLSFETVYVNELQEVRELAARAIVNDAVVKKVGQLKQLEVDGDLIEISEEISSERAAYRQLVDAVLSAQPPDADKSDEDVVVEVLLARVKALRGAADGLEEAGMKDSADELRAEAEALEENPKVFEQFDDMVNIVVLASTQNDVSEALKDLQQVTSFLQMIHSTVNEWIVTDSSLKGKDLAQVILNAEKAFDNTDGEQQ